MILNVQKREKIKILNALYKNVKAVFKKNVTKVRGAKGGNELTRVRNPHPDAGLGRARVRCSCCSCRR